MFVVLVGTILTGIEVFGPFDSAREAQEYCRMADGLGNDAVWTAVRPQGL
jgi:hypothetical protein